MEIKLSDIRKTGRGCATDLFVSDGVVEIKFHLYMRQHGDVVLRFDTTNKNRAEVALELLKKAGVDVKIPKTKKVWHIFASLGRLVGAEKPLKEAVVKLIKATAEKECLDEKTAQRWIDKLAGLPAYVGDRLCSKRPEVLMREVQKLRELGLVEGRHFVVKMPDGNAVGRLRILARGLAYIARLSVHGSGTQRKLARELLEHILRTAQEGGEGVYKRVKRAVDEGILWGSTTLKNFEVVVEVNDKERVVKIKEGTAWLEDGRLKIAVIAEVDGAVTVCILSFVKMKRGGVVGSAYANENVERLVAVIKALTGVPPAVAHLNNNTYVLKCNERHLKALTRYAELADAIKKWLNSR